MDRTGVIKAPSKSEVKKLSNRVLRHMTCRKGFTPREWPLGWNPMVYLNLKES